MCFGPFLFFALTRQKRLIERLLLGSEFQPRNLEPPNFRRMKQLAQQRAMDGKVLQPTKPSTFQEEPHGPREAKALTVKQHA